MDEGALGSVWTIFLSRYSKAPQKPWSTRSFAVARFRVNKGRASADTRLELGDEVRVPPLRLAEKSDTTAAPAREFPVLFEDEHLLAINKPSGVAVHGGSGVSYGVIEQLRRARPQAKFLELVHRLDKNVRHPADCQKRGALVALQDYFRHRQAHKTYAALVIGAWPEQKGH